MAVATLSLDDARKLVSAPSEADQAALAYLAGDLWQGGNGWVGPRAPDGDPSAAAILEEIQRILAGPNLIRALVRRHVAGVLGREPQWDVAGATRAADRTDPLTAWWDREVLPAPDDDDRAPISGGVLGLALARALCGDTPVIRLRVRPGTDAGRDLAASLARIAVEVLPGERAAVLDDLDEGPVAVAILSQGSRSLAARLGQTTPEDVAEVVSLDDQGRTVIAVGAEQSDPLQLGGRLTMADLRVPPLVTTGLLGLQRQAVKTATAMGRNTDTAGFVEVTYFNADRPDTLATGPARRNFFVGVQQNDGTITTPSMEVREPVPPDTFLDTLAGLRFAAYDEAHQLHALIGGDATASGESRRQAAADFLSSLGPSSQAVEAVTRWLLETAYALALALGGGRAPDGLRATARCTLGGTLPTVEELVETRAAVGERLLSRATYQAAAGVADTEAEDEAIDEERAAAAARAPQIAPTTTTTTTEGDAPDEGDASTEEAPA